MAEMGDGKEDKTYTI